MAAQDAELKLKVSLDLGFFRQQLAGLGQAAAGYSMPVQVKFDRRSVQNELNALGVNIRRRNYRLNIETNLSAEIAKADTLARKLSDLAGKIKAGGGSAFSRGPQGAAGLEKFMSEQGLSGKAFGVQQAQENIARQAILARLEKSALKQGGYNVPGLKKIIQDLGGTPTGKREDLVAQAKKLVEESNGIADAVFNNLKDLQMKLRPIRGQAQIGAPRSASNINRILDPIAQLTQNPRAAQTMLRMLPESRITTDILGKASQQAEYYEQVPSARGAQGLIKGFDPLLRAIADDFAAYTKSLKPGNPWLGKIGNGIGEMVANAAASPQAQKLLPAAGQTSASRMTRQMFAGLPPLQAPLIGQENAPLSSAASYMVNKARRTLGLPIGPSSPIGSMGRFPMAGMMGLGSMGQFPMSGMMGPSSQLGRITAQSSMFAGQGGGGGNPPGNPPGGGGGAGGMGGFARAMGGLNLPGAGVIRELGSEFAFATKQVLLFGQAYKLLAFIQSFPAQVGEAVSQLQNFRNTLGAISPTANEAAASNQLILDLVEKYNVPLQSARDGFTKLYASMAPAGFSGDEVRDLFTGITQAAATFGMSADKVDRVNYAFAQMASKGQVMSEELKGQLGDVLPGAMALFAEAAGFKGPKAIQDFSVALEDGAYKGEAMVALLKNVGVIMKEEFGPGAEGAARTFQGVINRMQNSMTLLYESFEPVAVNFLNGVVVPLTAGIKQISDGFNAFFTNTAAQTSGGFAIAQELERLRPAFDGISQNVSALVAQFGQFARIALEVGKVLLQIAGNPLVGYLVKLYAIALPINIALNVMRGLWAANALQLVIFNARVATGTGTLSAFRGMMSATGATAQATAASIRTAGITLRTFFATTGVGLVIVGISMLIEKFMSMNQALADTQAKALGAAQAIRSMSQTEARAEEQKIARNTRDLQNLQKSKESYKLGGEEMVPVQGDMAKRLQEGGVGVRRDLLGRTFIPKTSVTAEILRQQGLQSEAETRQRQIQFEEKQSQQPVAIAPIPPSEGDGKKKKGKELDTYDRSKLEFIQQQFDIEKQALDKKLQGEIISQTEYDISLAELKLESARLEIAEKYRLATGKTNKDNLSAADKALKLKDLDIAKTNELVIAENDRNIAVSAARLKITKPILEEIDRETMSISRQSLQMEALKEGRLNLSAAQEAELAVKERYSNLSSDEQALAKEEINLLRQQIQLRLENATALEKEQAVTEARIGLAGIGGGLRSGFTGSAAGVFERAMGQYGDSDYATKLANIETVAMQLRSVFEGLQGAINGVSSAFANVLTEGITNMISGTATAKEVFASFLQSVGQALSQAASQMIATYIAIGIAKLFAGLGGGSGGGGGGGVNAVPGAPAIDPLPQLPGMLKAANGAVWEGGFAPFQAFAKGGVVSGPTLGLVGEGRYNEAIVPLPDGKSIPVQLGGRSARDLMGGGAPGMPQAPSLNMKFETTKINGVEYVSREQLEVAMAETRRASISGGARQGMSMTLDKIKQSPSTRSSIGI